MTPHTLTYLDAYCERAGEAGIWAEPLNAITNAAFMIAAVLCARLLWKLRAVPMHRQLDIIALVITLFAIGVGSWLWHAHPTGSTLQADVIPILIFMNLFLLSALRRLYTLSWVKTAFYFVLFLAVNYAGGVLLPPDTLNGSVMYLPTYATLIVMTITLSKRDKHVGKVFEVITLAFTASLFFRTVDMAFCEMFPYGTHFLWHIINAYVLYRLLEALITKRA
jgi:hypothetical protein